MKYINADLHTAETYPIAKHTVGWVLDQIDGELDGIYEEGPSRWGPGDGEAITELTAIRDALFEVMADDTSITRNGTVLNEGLIQRFVQTHVAEEYLSGVAEQQLRNLIWDQISDLCATCGEASDYCQGHGVLG